MFFHFAPAGGVMDGGAEAAAPPGKVSLGVFHFPLYFFFFFLVWRPEHTWGSVRKILFAGKETYGGGQACSPYAKPYPGDDQLLSELTIPSARGSDCGRHGDTSGKGRRGSLGVFRSHGGWQQGCAPIGHARGVGAGQPRGLRESVAGAADRAGLQTRHASHALGSCAAGLARAPG